MRFLIFLISLSASAAVTNLTVTGATQTQISISYTAPTVAACAVEASKKADYSTLAHDVNNSLFPGEHLDSRAGSITTGRDRRVVIGKQGHAAIAAAPNGANYSRALQADTPYYIRVTCGGDTAEIQARTANLVVGDVRGEALAVEEPFKYKQITTNPVLMPEFVDPYTGVLTKSPGAILGWVYTASTAKTNISADCAQTITGFDSSCKFTDATGTNWTATTGTLTDAVRADDSNYAEYSGTSQDILILRLGSPRLGISSSVTEAVKIAFQNVAIRGLTTSTAGGGGEIETCISMDAHWSSPPTCDSPWITTTLGTSESTIRICEDSPCSIPDNPGGWMTYTDPSLRTKLGRSRVYNEVGALDTIKFAGNDGAADCNRLFVGETIYVYKSVDFGGYNLTVNSKSCGSSPPQFTAAETTINLTNYTGGYYTADGINSQHYALLVRKKSTTSGATIKIGYVLWRAAWSNTSYMQDKSGGMGQKCQSVPTSEGYYLCQAAQGVFGVKPNAAGDGYDMKFYGTLWISRADLQPGGTGLSQNVNLCGGPKASFFAWDITTAGDFYCTLYGNYPNPYKGGVVDTRGVFSRIRMNLVEKSTTDPDGNSEGIGPQIGITSITQLTPCLNSCTSTDDDYTLFGQAMKLTASWTDPLVPFDTRWGGPGCGLMLDDKTVSCGVSIGSQDSLSWSFAFDLGNGLPIGSGFVGTRGGNTQQLFAGMSYANNAASRGCSVHTSNNPVRLGTQPFIAPEIATAQPCTFSSQVTNSISSCTASSLPGSCTRCDTIVDAGNLIMDGYDYSGDKRLCSIVQLTSTWPNPSATTLWTGSQHPLWEAGDPVNASGCGGNTTYYFDQKWRRGDYMGRNGETMRIIQRNSATEYVVVRGWGTMQGSGSVSSHAPGDTMTRGCGGWRYNTPDLVNTTEIRGSVAWYPMLDPVGGMNSTYTFLSDFHNHALYGLNRATWDKWKVGVFDFDDYTTFKSLFVSKNFADMSIPNTASFAGKPVFVVGNSVEYHPGVQQVRNTEEPWFHDINPRLFHIGWTGAPTATLVAGKSNIYKLGGSALTYISPKHYDIDGFSDRSPLKFTDTLADDNTGRGKMCYAAVANDCFSGSVAGEFYFSNEIFDRGFTGAASHKVCVEAEFGGVGIDACIGNTGLTGVTQTRFPNANGQNIRNARYTRIVKREGMIYRPAATINASTDPLGFALKIRDMPQYVVLPKFPAMKADGAGTFRAIPATVTTVPAGTSTALIQFGYDGGFVCSRNKGNTCYAESATLNETTPFKWDHETLTGVSCGSGCTITIPAIANRVIYWRWVYRNAGGTVISAGATNVQAVN